MSKPVVKAKKVSKVLRDEQTYTTTKKQWPILWLPSEIITENKRSVEVRKAVWIELYRGVEFFPSRFVKEMLKNPTLTKGRDPEDLNEAALVESLCYFLEAYVENTRQVGVMHFDKRPRPNSQIELEDELVEAYGTTRQQASVIQQQTEQIENLRKRLADAGVKA